MAESAANGNRHLLPPSARSAIKSWRDRVRAMYIQRFYSFAPADLLAGLRHLGIQGGDVLLAHTSFDQFQGFKGGIGEAIRVLQDAVGEKSGLWRPRCRSPVRQSNTPGVDKLRILRRLPRAWDLSRRSFGVFRTSRVALIRRIRLPAGAVGHRNCSKIIIWRNRPVAVAHPSQAAGGRWEDSACRHQHSFDDFLSLY